MLDRLSRNVAFIANLMESGVSFVACDLPPTNSLTIHILAAVAEEERKMISQRTKAALARGKENGVKLGNPDNLTNEAAAKGRKLGRKVRADKANAFARSLIPSITAYKAEGLSLRGIARAFNKAQVLTASGRGGNWTPTAVKNVIERVEAF